MPVAHNLVERELSKLLQNKDVRWKNFMKRLSEYREFLSELDNLENRVSLEFAA